MNSISQAKKKNYMPIIKTALFILFTLFVAISCLPFLIILFPWRAFIGSRLLQFYSKISLKILRVKIEHADKIDFSDKQKGYILVANHENCLDIFLLSAVYGTLFLSKIEIVSYPLIGQIARMIGIVFVNRDSAEHRHQVVHELAWKAQGATITVFPQGTTCTIEKPLSFKRGTFKTIEINNNIKIVPVSIYYKEYKDLFWKPGESLLEHILNICSLKKVHVKLKAQKPVTSKDYKTKSVPEIALTVETKVLAELRKKY